MAEHNCAHCSLRAQYDQNPKSLKGRFWRWHIRFCPGWKGYMESLPKDERVRIEEEYDIRH